MKWAIQWMRAVGMLAVIAAAVACIGEYRVEKRVDDLEVTLVAPGHPLRIGDNPLQLEIRDRREALANAEVRVRYGLPPMPGMGAVDTEVVASRERGGFVFTASTHTAARWKLEVSIARPGKPEAHVGFHLDAM